MPTVSEALHKFLHARKTPANADLIDGWSIAMETQLNVAVGDGEPVEGKRSTFSNGTDTWHSIRAPKDANSEPHWTDYELRFALTDHAEGIGMTGWDWQNRRSLSVAYDFDALTSHATGVGITDEALAQVKEAACALPYVEVRRSTGGGGIHLRTYLDGIPCENHTVHAALARAILGMMSSECNFDFASQIDCCGGVMWIWHRKMTAENHGLELIKPATKVLTAADLPANWRDHIEVVTRKRSKVRVNALSDDKLDKFEALASAQQIIPLDDSHKAQIEALQRSHYTTLWIADHHLLQTHTCALKWLMDGPEAGELKLVGVFDTNSQGRNPGNPNCFLFALPNGAWRAYRFSPGVAEAETWTQDGEGWTTCYFNRRPDLRTAARAHGGVEDPEKGGYVFPTTMAARETVKDLLGCDFEVPDKLVHRKTSLSAKKDGRLMAAIAREKDDADFPGWLDKGSRWIAGFTQHIVSEYEDVQTDETVRALVTPKGEAAGLLIQQKNGAWVRQGLGPAKMALQSTGLPKDEAERKIGDAIRDPHLLVIQPFQPAWLPGRRCNIDAAQFTVPPEEGDHPHWDLIYNHTFAGLTEAIKKNPWFAENGIHSGGDYVRAWMACLIQAPFEPLPFIATVGVQNSGKSIVYEATNEFLFTSGIVNVNEALTRQELFNGELEGALLCVVEEISLAGNRKALDRLKQWTTARVLPIRRMRTDLYHVPCSAHFFMCCNQLDHIPVLAGDSRIVVCWVDKPANPIPKKELMAKLAAEAPAMLYTLKHWRLPAIIDRLRLPIVETEDKVDLADENSPVNVFLKECCQVKVGEYTPKDDVRLVYAGWCKAQEAEPLKPGPFTTQLKELTGGRVRPTICRNGKKQYRAYKNLVLVPDAIETYGVQA
jgi:hypothetical protein